MAYHSHLARSLSYDLLFTSLFEHAYDRSIHF